MDRGREAGQPGLYVGSNTAGSKGTWKKAEEPELKF